MEPNTAALESEPIESDEQPLQAIPAFLSVYELLLELFSHADSKTTAVAARSSRVLMGPALDVLWRVVPRASFLFSILCTLDGAASYDGHSTRRFDFERDLHPEDWDHFLPYSRRVEELSCFDGESSDRWVEPSHKALAKFSTSRPPHLTLKDIFPRLHHLTWFIYSHKVLRNLNIFLVPSLTFLEVKIESSIETKAIIAFLKQLKSRCAAGLKEFRLNTDFALSIFESDVLEVLRSMERLERLVIPRYYTNAPIFATIASLPHLSFIGQRKSYSWGDADDIEGGISSALDTLEVGAYPALRELTYDTLNLHDAKKLLSHRFAPKALTHLCVTSGKLEAPHSVHDFLACLADSALKLEEVDIGLSFPVTETPGHSTDITISTLRPLLLLPDLTRFGLAAHFPLKMSDEDLDAFTSGWRSLRRLWLNETPAYAVKVDVKSGLTLRALAVMAKNCPALEELSLFVDATNVPGQEIVPSSKRVSQSDLGALQAAATRLNDDEEYGPPTFGSLRYLNLGVSHIASTSAVANYINESISSPIPDVNPAGTSTPRHLQPSVSRDASTPSTPPESNQRSPLAPVATVARARPFTFDWSPRFWPAPMIAAEMDNTLSRRKEMWTDVSKMIPALMEQKVKADITRREMISLIRGLMQANVTQNSC